jgi:hypothetical protein
MAATARLVITIGGNETVVDLALSGHDVRYRTQHMHGRLEFNGHHELNFKEEEGK